MISKESKKKKAFEQFHGKKINSTGFDINILHALLAYFFIVLLKIHKTSVCTPNGSEAATMGAKEERGFVPVFPSLSKSVWKMMIFFCNIPCSALSHVSEMPRKLFCMSPATRNPAVDFGGSTFFSK